MKKFLTLVATAFMAANVFAQSATPLVLKRGTSAGFAGETEVYDFMMKEPYEAASFTCNVNSADYPKYILEFEQPLPKNFEVTYDWKESADPEGKVTREFGRAVGDGTTTKIELSFGEAHPYITEVRVQHNGNEETELKIKKLTLVGKDNTEKKIDAAFTGWAGTDNTKTYKGVVSYNKC